MAVRRRPSVDGTPTGAAAKTSTRQNAKQQNDPIEEFFWNIVSINAHFEDASFAWAQMLGVNVHQWMILMAIRELDKGGGISVRGVSAKLHSDPSFVTSQSKSLEKLGFVRRENSAEDARVVLMSLTPKAIEEIAKLQAVREPIKQSIFSELNSDEMHDLNAKLSALREKFLRAAKRLAAEL